MFYPSQISISKVKHLTGHTSGIFCLGEGMEPNSVMSGSGDGIVAQWEINGMDTAKGLARIPGSIFSLYYHKKLQLLFTGSLDGTVHITDLIKKEEVHKFIPDGSAVYDITIINDNNLVIACGSGKVFIYDVEHKLIAETIAVSEKSIRSIAVTPFHNDIIFSSSDHDLYVYDKNDLTLKNTLSGHQNSVFCAAFSKTGDFLISGSRDAQLKIWDSNNNYTLIKTLAAHMFTINDIKMSPDGRLFATAGRDKHIKIWDASNFNLLKVIDHEKYGGHLNSVNKLFWSNWNNSLISCGDDRTVMVWEIEA